MSGDRTPATAAQAKALSSPVRLRILRLCLDDELTNQQLAKRLDVDPSTMLYHARILVESGFLEGVPPRRNATGALEKPYRSTGLSWTLDLGDGHHSVTQAMLDAFNAELTEAGVDSIESSSRFVFHLDATERADMMTRIQSILDEYEAGDDERRRAGQPRFGGMFILHGLSDPS